MYMITALIPAYCPQETLLSLVKELEEHNVRCVVVNDGSPAEYDEVFARLPSETVLLRQPVNTGKGAAMKRGMEYIHENIRDCTVVTADADGQHLMEDILKTAAEAAAVPESLVLGVRSFRKEDVPFRSYWGNRITEGVFGFLTGVHVSDTQTGLRAFDSSMIPSLMQVQGDRYEYEMNQLLYCIRSGIAIREVPVAAVYEGNNECSHFHPFRDSFRIYSQILKFSLASVSSFVLDCSLFALFSTLFTGTYRLLAANVLARLISALFNYEVNRRAVFRDEGSRTGSLLRYASLAAAILVCNTAVLYVLSGTGMNTIAAKILTEAILFSVSWTVQNRYVFTDRKKVAQ